MTKDLSCPTTSALHSLTAAAGVMSSTASGAGIYTHTLCHATNADFRMKVARLQVCLALLMQNGHFQIMGRCTHPENMLGTTSQRTHI
jgi:hypothetical protein